MHDPGILRPLPLRSLRVLGDVDSSPSYPFDSVDAFRILSPYSLDEAVIKAIPLSVFTCKVGGGGLLHDCAMCLLEFEDDDYIRTLSPSSMSAPCAFWSSEISRSKYLPNII
ncbi:RING/U-box superfamily protein [Striga asiatica]|uniref:RING/U-box superfamily protein n=1 Tax=Striga asiatica TaxID=4170 RepID=A0A5A7QBZ3_STRAF|nr:RING/U-box superfamily protein [Striga asiatica]